MTDRPPPALLDAASGATADAGLPFALVVIVEADGWPPEAALQALAERVAAIAVPAAGLEAVPDSEVSLVFTDDAAIRVLNRDYRGKDAPTNVLSFPVDVDEEGVAGPLIGDIVLARETLQREADDLGLSFDAHLTHLIVHGLLHLFGYDHVNDMDAAEMEGLEIAILDTLGIANPYTVDAAPTRRDG